MVRGVPTTQVVADRIRKLASHGDLLTPRGYESLLRRALNVGVSLAGAMFITSVLFVVVMRYNWRVRWVVILLYSPIMVVDVVVLASTFTRIATGWVSLAMALCLFACMLTWNQKKAQLEVQAEERLWSMQDLRKHLKTHPRVSGCGVYVGTSDEEVPAALSVLGNKCPNLPERIVFVHVSCTGTPYVTEGDRVKFRAVDPTIGIYRLAVVHGFAERRVDMKAALARAFQMPVFNLSQKVVSGSETGHPTHYFVHSFMPVVRQGFSRVHRLQVRVFAFLCRTRGSLVSFYGLPPEDTIEVVSQFVIR